MRTQSIFLGAALAVSAPTYAIENLSDFNPAMSIIFDGMYYQDSIDGEGLEILEEHSSVLHAHHDEEHEHGGTTPGFNLRETELTLSGSVDSYFDARLNASLSEEGIELEEAWFSTRSLPAGLQIKAGKFLSAFGYHNEKHPHSWDFADQNLAYLSLLGDHGLSGKGMRLTWLAPTTTYLQFGVEALQGDELERFGAQLDPEHVAEEISASFTPVTEDEIGLGEIEGPQLGVAFVRVGPDLGTDHGLQLGLSWAHHTQTQSYHEEGGTDAFVGEGDADLYGAQAIFKRFAKGAYGEGSYSLQAEYLSYRSDQKAVYHTDPAETGLPLSLQQDGAYVQANYMFAPRWQVSLRSAAAGLNGEAREEGETESTRISRQHSAAVSWYATEFSRLRLQFNQNDIGTEDGREDFNQVMLQYNLSLGAHGAHNF